MTESEATYPCKVCGRKFIRSSLQKHEPACKKITKMHRKVFDSGKQRAANSDIPYQDIKKVIKEKEKHGGIFPRPVTHWRERHEEFISAVSASKNVKEALKTGAPLPPPPRTSFLDYVQCNYCGRSFNSNAAERHIDFCREQHARGQTGAAKARSASSGRNTTAGSAKSVKSTTNSIKSMPPSNGKERHSAPKTGATRTASQSRRASRERVGTTASIASNHVASGVTIAGVSIVGKGRDEADPSTYEILKKNRPSVDLTNNNNNEKKKLTKTSHLPTPAKRSTSAPRKEAAAGHTTKAGGKATTKKSNH